jgi:outer membrane protein OmpA-like peptidoglycan-associated protein
MSGRTGMTLRTGARAVYAWIGCGGAFGVMGLLGCGTVPPPRELVDARAAYQAAAQSAAAEQAPAQLHDARQALNAAEKVFDSRGDSPETRDTAYIALRKAQLADSAARTVLAQKEAESLSKEARDVEKDALSRVQRELQKTREAFEREKHARELLELQRIASVRQESRGTVITLSGSVLFATNAATLFGAAQRKLDEVADAILKSDPDASIVVEGHTDSAGKATHNDELSRKRANAVREYLISRGIGSEKIRSVGVGSGRPIASNKTAEGRANNRRVEIIVEPPK